MTNPQPDREARFRQLYADHVDALLAYAIRRSRDPDDAADLVADTFLVVWRRLDEVPPGDESRLWLYGVARRVRSNAERGGRRRERLGERLRQQLVHTYEPDHAADVAERAVVREALRRLGERDREVLMLSVWEDLEPREIAQVLGITATSARARLSRARRRLRGHLSHAQASHTEPPPGHGSRRTPLVRSELASEEGR